MGENIEVKDVQKTEYLDKNGLDMLWAKVKENTYNQVEIERNRAVAKENSIVDTKADKSEFGNYVPSATFTALEKKVSANTAAIDAKQDKPDDGNMFLQVKHDSVSGYFKRKGELKFTNDDNDSFYTSISPSGIYCWNENSSTNFLRITSAGITLDGGEGTSGYAFTTNGKTARIPTKLSQLANDSNFITADDIDFTPYATIEALTTVEQKVTANTTAISAKQDAGNYIPYNAMVEGAYQINKVLDILTDNGTAKFGPQEYIAIQSNNGERLLVQPTSFYGKSEDAAIDINTSGISLTDDDSVIRLNSSGVTLPYGDNNRVLTSNGTTINIGEYAKQSDLSAQLSSKANRSDLTALEQKITTNTTALEGKQDKGNYVVYSSKDENGYAIDNAITMIGNNTTNKTKIVAGGITFRYNDNVVKYSHEGIKSNKFNNCLVTSDGTFKPISDFALKSELPTVPTKTSQLMNDSNFMQADEVDHNIYTLNGGLIVGIKNNGQMFLNPDNIQCDDFILNGEGIIFTKRRNSEIPTADGSFIDINNYVLKSTYDEKIAALEARIAALEAKHPEAAA